jgi:hypothetical protein
MTRTLLAATAALTLMTGVATAQTTTETTTTESTAPVVVPVPPPVVVPPPMTQTTSERTVDANGVVTDHTRTTTSGTSVSPYGDLTTTKKTVETTTSR